MSMPNFTKSSPAVVERFYELLELVPDANRKAMFGFPAATIGGNLFFSLFNENAILRLPDAERERLGPDLEIEQFAPAPGRPMTGFMVLPANVFASPAAEPWILAAAAHARSMPPKKPKKPVRGPKTS